MVTWFIPKYRTLIANGDTSASKSRELLFRHIPNSQGFKPRYLSLRLKMFSIEDDDPWSVNKDVFDLICNFIQRSASLSITDVASRLNALYPDSRVQGNKKESAESFLLEMWDVVINVAVQLEPCSAEQNKLALLMNTLRDIETEQTLHIWGSPIILWKDLPLLGPVMTERLNSANFNP